MTSGGSGRRRATIAAPIQSQRLGRPGPSVDSAIEASPSQLGQEGNPAARPGEQSDAGPGVADVDGLGRSRAARRR